MNYYLAIDIGASSGRHILFWKDFETIHMKEIYRFKNASIKKDGYECWDINVLFQNILKGLRVCKDIQTFPVSVAIDTWGVDYVLLDKNGRPLTNCICYRDHSFDTTMDEVFKILPKKEIYEHTGIQFQQFNTIYQLYEMSKRVDLQNVKDFLMMPDYLNYKLTGICCNEYTNATTTQLVNAVTKTWDVELLQKLHYPVSMFHPLRQPGSKIGNLKEEIIKEIGYDTQVICCASHDTGSAYLVSDHENSVIISSGTWSLIGVHRLEARTDRKSMELNYTNEGGFHTIRYLKNIMGLWLIQEVQRNLNNAYSFQELCDIASISEPFDTIIDVNDHSFLKPLNMMEAIDEYCDQHGLIKPHDIGQYIQCICRSLAIAYRDAIEELEQLNNTKYDSITIIGGGVQNEYLNTWIEKCCKRNVIRGVVEATAFGNALCQMYSNHEFMSLNEGREFPLIIEERLSNA